jgi:hypothetical protein
MHLSNLILFLWWASQALPARAIISSVLGTGEGDTRKMRTEEEIKNKLALIKEAKWENENMKLALELMLDWVLGGDY